MPTIWQCQICVSAGHNHVDQNSTSSLQYSPSTVPAVIQIDCEAVSFARNGPRCVAVSVGCLSTAAGKRGVPEVPPGPTADTSGPAAPGSSTAARPGCRI